MEFYSSPVTFAVKHKDEKVRAASRSGGVFTALSDAVLEKGGVVYGAVLDGNMTAHHVRAADRETRDRMRGSKYVESRLGTAYKDVLEDLRSGIPVLFTGTSCQVAGLRAFLGRDYENLLLADILCHGVPSPMLWRKYLQWQEEKHGRCTEVDFRNKTDFGWADHVESLRFENGGKVDSKVYSTLFYSHQILRPSCYECRYKTVMHPGDITMADYWEIERALPGFNDNRGVSLVMVNNDRGLRAFEAVRDGLVWEKTEYENSTRKSMFTPANRPQDRARFWRDVEERDFGYIANHYGGNALSTKIEQKLRSLVRVLRK